MSTERTLTFDSFPKDYDTNQGNGGLTLWFYDDNGDPDHVALESFRSVINKEIYG